MHRETQLFLLWVWETMMMPDRTTNSVSAPTNMMFPSLGKVMIYRGNTIFTLMLLMMAERSCNLRSTKTPAMPQLADTGKYLQFVQPAHACFMSCHLCCVISLSFITPLFNTLIHNSMMGVL